MTSPGAIARFSKEQVLVAGHVKMRRMSGWRSPACIHGGLAKRFGS
jgi:hypothetical protein